MDLVVGAAIVREGRVLAARRTTPAAAAGKWEFPGGKVEPGESPEEALAREIAEELGCRIRHGYWLQARELINDTLVLIVAVVELVAVEDGGDGEPEPREHDRITWLSADELDDVDWLEPDRPFLDELRAALPGLGVRR